MSRGGTAKIGQPNVAQPPPKEPIMRSSTSSLPSQTAPKPTEQKDLKKPTPSSAPISRENSQQHPPKKLQEPQKPKIELPENTDWRLLKITVPLRKLFFGLQAAFGSTIFRTEAVVCYDFLEPFFFFTIF